MKNIQGKTVTIFIVLIAILLISSTSIGFYLYHQEKQMRKQAESDLEASHASEAKLQADLKQVRHDLAVAQDKGKEADDKINNLMDEADLNEGLRKELKTENTSLKEKLDAAQKEKDKIKADVDAAQKKYQEVQEMLKAEQDKSASLQKTIQQMNDAKSKADADYTALRNSFTALKQQQQQQMQQLQQQAQQAVAQVTQQTTQVTEQSKVNLDKIVVRPTPPGQEGQSGQAVAGRVLSIDEDAEFIVCNLGSKQGLKAGDVLSIYHEGKYMGDVRVSRVQGELAAADAIAPFTTRKVAKNDTVTFKP